MRLEIAWLGRVWIDALVFAILLGAAVRLAWVPPAAVRPGIAFSAKTLLEVAVVLLGGTVSGATLIAVGPALLVGTALVVIFAITLSLVIGRTLGLSTRLAVLVACGNSICGNSAIAAVAPVVRANGDDVAKSIAFTAVLGIAVVLLLPVVATALRLDGLQAGALAGLTVYAVPQVIAASAPFGATAVQMGTLVKLIRVMMLGPVCFVLSIALRGGAQSAASRKRPVGLTLVPWFVLGFLALLVARSLGLLSARVGATGGTIASVLTIIAMAALGLGVNIRDVTTAGGRVTAAVVLSLLGLIGISLLAIHVVRV